MKSGFEGTKYIFMTLFSNADIERRQTFFGRFVKSYISLFFNVLVTFWRIHIVGFFSRRLSRGGKRSGAGVK